MDRDLTELQVGRQLLFFRFERPTTAERSSQEIFAGLRGLAGIIDRPNRKI